MRKKLLFSACAAFFVLAAFLAFGNRKPNNPLLDAEEELVLFDAEQEVRREFIPLPFSQEELQGPDEYRAAYSRGYVAFLSQMGLPLPPPEQVVQYTSLVNEEEKSPEEEEKGYADGYHRAAESFSCPASKVRYY